MSTKRAPDKKDEAQQGSKSKRTKRGMGGAQEEKEDNEHVPK